MKKPMKPTMRKAAAASTMKPKAWIDNETHDEKGNGDVDNGWASSGKPTKPTTRKAAATLTMVGSVTVNNETHETSNILIKRERHSLREMR